MRFEQTIFATKSVHVALQGLLILLLISQGIMLCHYGGTCGLLLNALEPYPRLQAIIVSYAFIGTASLLLVLILEAVHETRSVTIPICRGIKMILHVILIPLLVFQYVRTALRKRTLMGHH